jgi:hypothetical protein
MQRDRVQQDGARPGGRRRADTVPRQRARADLLGPLFPSTSSPGVTRSGVLLGLIAIVAGSVVSLLRTAGTGPLQSIWEEDSRAILNDAINLPGLRAVVRPVAGYYLVGPRLIGQLAALFPVSWAAAILSISAAVIVAALAVQVYVASGTHIRPPLARLLVSAPLLFAPVAENSLSEIYNRPVCLHFFAMYALFWLLLWTPASRTGRAGLLATVAFTAFSTILIVGYLPLAAVRAYQRRDRFSSWVLVTMMAGSVLQLSSLVTGISGRAEAGMRLDPAWATGTYVFWALPGSMLGFRATSGLAYLHFWFFTTVRQNLTVIVLSWLVMLAVLAVAWLGARRVWLRPRWRLAILAAGHSFWLNTMMVMANGAIAQRYLLPVELLLFSTVVLLLMPGTTAKPLALFAVFVLVVSVFNYRWTNTYRAKAPLWTDQIALARERCLANPGLAQVGVRGGPQPFWSVVSVPCHLLLPKAPCQEPRCQYLDPPRVAGRSTL